MRMMLISLIVVAGIGLYGTAYRTKTHIEELTDNFG